MIGYGKDYSCAHGEPWGDCPKGCKENTGSNVDPMPDEPRTELGYANRLVHVYGDRLRYVAAWRKWLAWNGVRWAPDATGQADRWMKVIARRITCAAMEITDLDRRKAALSAARRGEASAGISGALKLASTVEGIAIEPEALDADPFLLNVANGTLDLRTMELGPHEPDNLLTKVTRAAYRPEVTGSDWTKFLDRVQPKAEMRDFLARLVGHAVEGRVVAHILPIFYGEGANGKSTFIDAVMYSLGEYADTADPDLLTAKTFDAHPTGVADLFGLRLAVLHESDAGRRLAEGTVKRLTGGDRVKARRMREDFWSFDPSHSFMMLTNHKPLVGGTDEGIWRRLRLVPWDVIVPVAEQDLLLGDRLELEADVVLAWLLAGYSAWRQDGLGEPEAVVKATREYRDESDALRRFLHEECHLGPAFSVRSSLLFETWSAWCLEKKEEPGTAKAFTTALQKRGFDVKKTRDFNIWSGIGVIIAQPAERRS